MASWPEDAPEDAKLVTDVQFMDPAKVVCTLPVLNCQQDEKLMAGFPNEHVANRWF